MTNAERDNNNVPSILWVSSVDGITPVPLKVNPATWKVLVELTWWSVWSSTQTSLTTWENITVWDALFIESSDWKVYKTDASDDTKIKFVWFASETIAINNPINIDTSWINNNQTWLSIGLKYYLSDTPWIISSTPWTIIIKVGRSLTATAIEVNTSLNIWASKNKVFVDLVSEDLPPILSSKRTLKADTIYDFQNKSFNLVWDADLFLSSGTEIINIEVTTDKWFIFDKDWRSADILNAVITYTGSGTIFSVPDLWTWIIRLQGITVNNFASTGKLFDMKDPSSANWVLLMTEAALIWADDWGLIEDVGCIWRVCRLYLTNQGFQFINNTLIDISTFDFQFGNNVVGSRHIDISGTAWLVKIQGIQANPWSNEHIFFFDPSLVASSLNVSLCPIVLNLSGASTANIFDTWSLTQTAPIANFVWNNFIPDSTVKSKMSFSGNGSVTDIISVDTPVEINALWSTSTIDERMAFQDWATFDNTTDFITSVKVSDWVTTINHWLTDADPISFVANWGLPTEIIEWTTYFVVNSTATTFQIETSVWAWVLNFTDDWTTPNYYRHTTWDTEWWVVSTWQEDVSLSIWGWATISKSWGWTVNVRIQLIKTNISFAENNEAFWGTTSWSSNNPQSSPLVDIVNLSQNEWFKIFVENLSDGTDLVVSSAFVTFKK